MDFISFIIPIRDKSDEARDLFAHLSKLYTRPEIIFVHQLNDMPFMRGQLMNIGCKTAKHPLFVLMDVDLRFYSKFDFVQKMAKHKRPFLPFNRIDCVDIINGRQVISGVRGPSSGGMCCITRKQFVSTCGFSNLCMGWGGEDDIFAKRAKFIRFDNVILHVNHLRAKLPVGYRDYNKEIIKSASHRPPTHDGIGQLTYELTNRIPDPVVGAVNIGVKKIGVRSDYRYMEEYTMITKFHLESDSDGEQS
jgi:hypothetical protein